MWLIEADVFQLPLLHKHLNVVRHLMKPYITYLILFIATLQVGCKARENRSIIKTTKQSNITLRSISSPYIVFTLQSGDTISFSNQDFINIIYQAINSEIKSGATVQVLVLQLWQRL